MLKVSKTGSRKEVISMKASAARQNEATIVDGLKKACKASGGTYVIERGEVHKLHLLLKEGGHHGIVNSPKDGGYHNQVTMANGTCLVFDYYSEEPLKFEA